MLVTITCTVHLDRLQTALDRVLHPLLDPTSPATAHQILCNAPSIRDTEPVPLYQRLSRCRQGHRAGRASQLHGHRRLRGAEVPDQSSMALLSTLPRPPLLNSSNRDLCQPGLCLCPLQRLLSRSQQRSHHALCQRPHTNPQLLKRQARTHLSIVLTALCVALSI